MDISRDRWLGGGGSGRVREEKEEYRRHRDFAVSATLA